MALPNPATTLAAYAPTLRARVDALGGGSVVVNRQPWREDSFDGTPEMLKDRPGWSATTDPRWKVANGEAYKQGKFDSSAFASYDRDLLNDYEVSYDYDYRGGTDAYEAARGSLLMFVQSDAAGGGVAVGNDLITQQVGPSLRWSTRGTGTTPRQAGVGTLTFRVAGGLVYSAFEGVWNVQSLDVSGSTVGDKRSDGVIPLSAAGNPHGRVGMYNSTFDYPYLRAIRVRQVRMHIVGHARAAGVRAVGATLADVPFWGTYDTGLTPVQWRGRVLAIDQTTVVQDFVDMQVTAASGGTFAASLAVPEGGPFVAEIGFVASDGIFYSMVSRRFTVGDGVLGGGQSNQRGRSSVREIYDRNELGDGRATVNTGSSDRSGKWDGVEIFGNGSLEYGIASNTFDAAKQMVGHLDKPVSIITSGQNGTSITGLVPGTGGWDELVRVRNCRPGIFRIFQWDQGENDCDAFPNSANPLLDGYAGTFSNQLVPAVRTLTGNPGIPILVNPPGRYSSAHATLGPNNVPWADIDRQRNRLHQIFVGLAGTAGLNVRLSASKLGVDHGPADEYHYTFEGRTINARRDAFTAAKALGANIADGRGPIVNGAGVRSGATLTFDIDANGATAFTGFVTRSTGPQTTFGYANTFKGYQVSADNFATLLPVSSIAIANGKLVITLASAPGGAVKLRSFYGASYDDSQLLYGTGYSDGRDPLPVFPIWVPLSTN